MPDPMTLQEALEVAKAYRDAPEPEIYTDTTNEKLAFEDTFNPETVTALLEAAVAAGVAESGCEVSRKTGHPNIPCQACASCLARAARSRVEALLSERRQAP